MQVVNREEALDRIEETLNILDGKQRLTSAEHIAEICIKIAKTYILNYSKELESSELQDKYKMYSEYLRIMAEFTEYYSKESMYVFTVIAYRFLEELSKEIDSQVLSSYARILKEDSISILESIDEESETDTNTEQ